ncbi:MAG TPA: glycosyltransferase [Candidatus Paceibacterota bacterium]|nr:glycosyltransferase [Candidatus Paceibacterota bacterium]
MAKRVLFVVTKSNFGGAQRYVFDLATNLPREFEPFVAFGPSPSGTPGQLARMLTEKHIRTVMVPELTRDVHLMADVRALFALIRLMRREKPDVVHLNSSKAGGLGVLAARLAGIPTIIFTIHGLPEDEHRDAFQMSLIAFFTWMTALLSHRTIAITQDSFLRMRRKPFLFRKVVLIHNGIPAPDFVSRQESLKALRSIDPSIPDICVGTIAELHRNKDLITAIDAIAQTDEHLVVIGDGEKRAALAAHARERGVLDRIHFLGYVADASRYLRAFGAFLLTSIKEGLPYVLLEAGHAHVPIVATDIPGVRDVVLNDFTGLLVPPRDAEKTAQALQRVMHDARLAESITTEMGTRVRASFSFTTMIEKTAQLYVGQ